MDLNEILQLFGGSEITDTSSYELWAMKYFHDKSVVENPYLNMTVDIDLTEARAVYEQHFKSIENASFQAYIVWNLIRALQEHCIFNTRRIGGKWYRFSNLPVFMPIAIGGDFRFKDAILFDCCGLDWAEFCACYRRAIDNEKSELEMLPQHVWSLCTFVGNLPNMNFKSFTLHQSATSTGRPFFYFGQRRVENNRLLVPVSITFDHANSDPFVLEKLMNSVLANMCEGVNVENKLSA
mgnify:CR=1 FL=1